jgi:phosphoserine phosphatase
MPERQALEKILDITRLMAAKVDLDSLLETIVASTMELLVAERASILLYDAPANQLVSRIAVGEKALRFPADCGIAGATIATRRMINVPDAYADARFNPEVDRHTGFHTRSILSIPLDDFDGELVGVLQVLNKIGSAFNASDEQLAAMLAAQAGVALQRARLLHHYHEKQAMEQAMGIARDIQRGLLPKQAPGLAGFDIAGLSEPADQTGGDIYDFIPLPDNRWLLVVADATGHGIGPALVITEVRAMIRTMCLDGVDLARMLTVTNRFLASELDGRFVTCFIGLLDPEAGTLTYASAGHGPILFYSHRLDEFVQMAATGLPLGMLVEADYAEQEVRVLEEGDFCAVTTDGFFEATAPGGEFFGVERMMVSLHADREQSARQMLQNLYQQTTAFLEGTPPQDDRTGVIVRRLPT